ncbi:hypothetical protein VTN77DRAFT_2046 [Rasamsonia byssochlamydoides]|uniref:uncharacterized protein n=1 Tax=Rasamsonia byssochlamydoides TaxID=89139 RepID=UPI0037430BE1
MAFEWLRRPWQDWSPAGSAARIGTRSLARYALMVQGEQSKGHMSRVRRGNNYDNVTANRARAAANYFDAKCFGVLCSGFLDKGAIEEIASGLPSPESESVTDALNCSSRYATMFLDATGALLPTFTVCLPSDRSPAAQGVSADPGGVLYADMDLDNCFQGKQYHNVVGSYQRLDVFQLKPA